MISGILAKKLGMTQIFVEGQCVPVTILEAAPCVVMQIKRKETDGYNALQLGVADKKEKHSTKAEMGHAKKANTSAKKFVREIPWDGKDDIKVGDMVTLEHMKNIKIVDIIGIVKGRGFAGTVKRHHFQGGPKTHGQSDRTRAPGSIGASANPSRTFPGQRACGHMGANRCTVHNSKIAHIDDKSNIIAIKGGIPGYNTGYVIIRRSVEDKG